MSKRSWLRADVIIVGLALAAAAVVAWVIIGNDREQREAERIDELVGRATPTLAVGGGLQSGTLTRAELLELVRLDRARDDARYFVPIRRQLRTLCSARDIDIDLVFEQADLEELFPDEHLRRATGAGCGELDMPDGTTWVSPALTHGVTHT